MQELERKIEKLEREIKFSGMRRCGFRTKKSALKCYKCGIYGHIAKFCQNKIWKKSIQQSKIYVEKGKKRVRKIKKQITIYRKLRKSLIYFLEFSIFWIGR